MKKMAPRIIIFLMITVALIVGSFKSSFIKSTKNEVLDINVLEWNNYYEGNNIEFYFMNPNNENVKKFGEKYSLNKFADEEDSFVVAINYLNWLYERIDYSENKSYSVKNAIDIELKNNEKIKTSQEEIETLFTEGAAFLNAYVRIGKLNGVGDLKANEKSYYDVCEIWSKYYNKWIIVDIIDGYYIEKNNEPLSVVEVLNEGIENLDIVDIKNLNNEKKYLSDKKATAYTKEINKYLDTYSISIDNNKYGVGEINSVITYIKKGSSPQIQTKEGFADPTIFVQREYTFNINPHEKYYNDKSDDKITLLFSKLNIDSNNKGVKSFIAGAFENSVQVKNYYYNINGSDWIKVSDEYYFYLDIKPGRNVIKISQDGKTVIREVVLQNNLKAK